MKELTAEIFAVGKWNKIPVTLTMLKELETNFTLLGEVLDVPLKISHDDEQALKDGDELALGWIDEVWVEGQKLFAHFKGMPKIVYDAIDKELFKNVSIEALFDVTHKGQNYGAVLTAVALLGVELPAVNTLSDLKTYMTNKNISFSSLATFSKKPTVKEDHTMSMTADEQAEFDRLKAENKTLKQINVDNATEMTKFSTNQNTLQTEIDAMKKEGKDKEFAAVKQSITDDLEALVKASKIKPATRDDLLKDLTTENLAQVQFTTKTLKSVTGSVDPGTDEEGTHKGDQKFEGMTAGDKVAAKANEMKFANTGMTFSAAANEVLRTDAQLAREYADENDGGAA